MNDQRKLSRRSLLGRAAWLAGATLAGTVIPIAPAPAQQKAAKDAMKYQEKPNGDQMCSSCSQFVAPSSCKVVDGTISPNGWCMAWVKKA